MKKHFSIIALTLLLCACSQQIPSDYTQSDALPRIYPDYVDVTVPVNIAPLSFQMDDRSDEMAVRYSFEGQEIICSGEKAQPDIDEWKKLTNVAKGKAIQVTQGFWNSDSQEDYLEKYALSASAAMNAYNFDDLSKVICIYNPNANLNELVALAEACSYRAVQARRSANPG